ncbi:ATP-dependent DNA helicase RecQ [Weissella oryzae SG25]|uniref:DNA helicase RecQ n=1 Tax=Weissella oryzae (strain DSM 25784 / JCM 18191 / LMG 30913 / SG25) TaxID=1329250 RepID=A0A069CWI0_WEIOS|nr:DNA helicase RecQ [Weissella oryzae]GAK31784.1 ATP-dependent DNA helicase RecQ [Weissella oryzae SG25]
MQKSLEVLQKTFGYDEFRPGQAEIIDGVLAGQRTLGVMPTGGGKSLTYQIPALLLAGTTIVVSPLISLMQNQVAELQLAGVDATLINSSLDFATLRDRQWAMQQGRYKLVYIAPERLEDPNFYQTLLETDVAMVVIDEVHVLSQWGHDFRPSYLHAVELIDQLPAKPLLMALTATATARVQTDLEERLHIEKKVVTGFARNNLILKIEKGLSDKEKQAYILDYVKNHLNQVGIIYAGTRKKVDELTQYLQAENIKAVSYHAGMPDQARSAAQKAFLYDDVDVIVATNAFGMGINKTNVRYVIHATLPGSVEAYYQEIGRAGRDGLSSEAILLYSPADIRLQRFFIDNGQNDDAAYRQNEYQKLQEMTNFAATQMCLPRYIMQYFGEDMADCGQCSNCTDQRELVDVTEEAQKVLTNIYRMTQTGHQASKTTAVQVLRGKLPDKMAWTKFDQLSTYGLMAKTTLKRLNSFIDYLIADNYIQMQGEYNSLSLTDLGAQVVKGQQEVRQRQASTAQNYTRLTKVVGGALFETLRAKRLELARAAGNPPYTIFSDQTLMELSLKKPQTIEELLKINGVGPVKAEKYGEIFMEIINSETEGSEEV